MSTKSVAQRERGKSRENKQSYSAIRGVYTLERKREKDRKKKWNKKKKRKKKIK